MKRYIVIFGAILALVVLGRVAFAADVPPPDAPPVVSLVEGLGGMALAVLAWLAFLARRWLKWSSARELVAWAEARLSLAVAAAKSAYQTEAAGALADGVFTQAERARARERALEAFWLSVTPEALAGALKALGLGDGRTTSAETWASGAIDAALPPAGSRPSMPAPR